MPKAYLRLASGSSSGWAKPAARPCLKLQFNLVDSLKEEINELIVGNHEAAKAKVRSDQPARAKQSAISKAKSKASPSTVRPQWSEEDWNKWNYGGCHGRAWYSAAEWGRCWGH